MSSSPDIVAIHARSVEAFLDRVRAVPDDAWERATPCTDWNVRELVNHVVGEDRWTGPLVAGKTIADVGDSLDGDLLGADPKEAAQAAGKEAMVAFGEPGAAERTVHLSFGDTPASEYAWQLTADHLIHGWDLAVATGGNTHLDPEVVGPLAAWFKSREELYRGAGAIGERPEIGSDAVAADQLLAAFGRDPHWRAP
jgi:uncharacterized protein (TIGR03086 family)